MEINNFKILWSIRVKIRTMRAMKKGRGIVNRKIVLSKTILFIAIVLFVVLFKTIFGAENTLIGVTSVTALLMFLERDLTIEPWRYMIRLIGLNLFIGIMATLASMNLWLAIPINFIAIFILGYSLLYDLRKPMYLPFILQYLFILASPVAVEQLPKRMLALICGAVFIILVQLITNRGRLTKAGNKLLDAACMSISNKIIAIKNKNDVTEIDKKINQIFHQFRKLLYDKRENEFYLTEEGMIKLNISISLQKISYLIDKIRQEDSNQEILDSLIEYLNILSICIKDKGQATKIKEFYENSILKYNDKDLPDNILVDLKHHLKFLNDNINNLDNLSEEHYDNVKKIEEIPLKYKKGIPFKISMKKDSIRFSYAIRLAIGITLAGFIKDFFTLSEGRWIMFTVLSLIVPVYELSKQKVKDRLFATVVGGIIVTILFSIFQDITIRTLILILAGYIGSYLVQYRYTTICVTVSAVGAVALMGDTPVITINRILLVALGAVIATLLNKFVYPFTVEDHNRELKKMYQETIDEMFTVVYEVAQGGEGKHRIKNLIIVASLIEERLKANNQIRVDNQLEALEKARGLLIVNIYDLYLWISINQNQEIDFNCILEDFREKSKDHFKNDRLSYGGSKVSK